ncbi:hypothetical protein BRADI_3g05076v3 [Brachypodium distachyon]|uniref:Uncharacterized protein n=1 Tax=Brachypodium distachyon TaxID=15368 RepID=A0A2K2CVB7_BRADI|nr:hypothetical protein BRADI_3g05076v3 [Brachypodium distachyon]
MDKAWPHFIEAKTGPLYFGPFNRKMRSVTGNSRNKSREPSAPDLRLCNAVLERTRSRSRSLPPHSSSCSCRRPKNLQPPPLPLASTSHPRRRLHRLLPRVFSAGTVFPAIARVEGDEDAREELWSGGAITHKSTQPLIPVTIGPPADMGWPTGGVLSLAPPPAGVLLIHSSPRSYFFLSSPALPLGHLIS